jgi:enamine deaminase RidA (YjgF/YER057c/UK114 family)
MKMEWKREIITPKTAVKHPSTCSGMIKVGPFLFVAGQIAMFEDRTVVQGYKDIDEEGRRMLQADVNWGAHFREEKIAAQAWQVFSQIKRMVEDGGSNMENLISMRILLTDINHFPVVERVRNMFYSRENMPIITTMQVVALCPPDALLEIEVEAFIPDSH